jgi:hypothetical protein
MTEYLGLNKKIHLLQASPSSRRLTCNLDFCWSIVWDVSGRALQTHLTSSQILTNNILEYDVQSCLLGCTAV